MWSYTSTVTQTPSYVIRQFATPDYGVGYYNSRPKTNIERIRDAVEDIDNNGLGLVVTGTTEDTVTTLDKTYEEIYNAFSNGINVVILWPNEGEDINASIVVAMYTSSDDFCLKDASGNVFVAASMSGYPSYTNT